MKTHLQLYQLYEKPIYNNISYMKTHLQVYQLKEKPIYNNNISYTETPSVNISV